MKTWKKQDEIFLKKLGERIASLRKEKKITQVELGFRCEIEKSNIRRIESGRTNPTILTLKKISAGIEIPLNELLNFKL